MEAKDLSLFTRIGPSPSFYINFNLTKHKKREWPFFIVMQKIGIYEM